MTEKADKAMQAVRVQLERDQRPQEEISRTMDWMIAAKMAERGLRRRGLRRNPTMEEIEEQLDRL